MFANWTSELDKDGDEIDGTEIENGSADDVVDFVAEDLDSNTINTSVDEKPFEDSDQIPDTTDMSEVTLDEGLERQDDENDQDDTAEETETDEIDQSDETQDENEDYEDIDENDETEHLDDDLTEIEELFEDEEDLITENTDVETDSENSDSLFDQNDDIEETDNDDLELEEIDFSDFSFTETSENDNIEDYGDSNQSNFDAFSDEQFSPLGETTDLPFEDNLRYGEGGDLEVSLSDGEWLQNDSDVSDTDLGSKLQLQFQSLSEINTEDVEFDFNFDDAGTDGTVLGELADLEDDDATNMLDDLDSALLVDDEFSDVESRF